MTTVQICGSTQIQTGSIQEEQLDVATLNLFQLYLKGKDPVEYRAEYMAEIEKLSFVNDNFDKIRAYKQIERLFKK